jgi:hypothetical protein
MIHHGDGAVAGVFKAVILGFSTGILGLIVSLVPLGLDLEESVGLHMLFKLRGMTPAPAEVMIVSPDDASAAHLPRAGDLAAALILRCGLQIGGIDNTRNRVPKDPSLGESPDGPSE